MAAQNSRPNRINDELLGEANLKLSIPCCSCLPILAKICRDQSGYIFPASMAASRSSLAYGRFGNVNDGVWGCCCAIAVTSSPAIRHDILEFSARMIAT